MGRHRNRLKILEDILSVISSDQEVRKTHIMYKAYLSYNLLTRYLNDLIEANLIKCIGGKCYLLTEKGQRFLAKFSEYSRLRQRAEQQMNNVEDKLVALKEMCPGNSEN
jgi:molybdate transport repressor ModE-like protein